MPKPHTMGTYNSSSLDFSEAKFCPVSAIFRNFYAEKNGQNVPKNRGLMSTPCKNFQVSKLPLSDGVPSPFELCHSLFHIHSSFIFEWSSHRICDIILSSGIWGKFDRKSGWNRNSFRGRVAQRHRRDKLGARKATVAVLVRQLPNLSKRGLRETTLEEDARKNI